MGSIFDNNVSLKSFNTYHVGGCAKYLAVCNHLQQICSAVKSSDYSAEVIGRGSNILVSDSGYDGHIIINRADTTIIQDGEVLCYSGQTLARLAAFYAINSLSGMEWACGIPGSVGGAVIMNAGAHGASFGEYVSRVLTITKSGKQWISASDCNFMYRQSNIPGVVLAVKLKYALGNKADIKSVTRQYIDLRKATQPSGFSAGSVFKAADKPAGVYIQNAGLKGFRVGGAEVSSKHANFIINDGSATAADIRQIINTIKGVVFDKFGIKLQEEIKYLGEF